jgi:hypothetical protein
LLPGPAVCVTAAVFAAPRLPPPIEAPGAPRGWQGRRTGHLRPGKSLGAGGRAAASSGNGARAAPPAVPAPPAPPAEPRMDRTEPPGRAGGRAHPARCAPGSFVAGPAVPPAPAQSPSPRGRLQKFSGTLHSVTRPLSRRSSTAPRQQGVRSAREARGARPAPRAAPRARSSPASGTLAPQQGATSRMFGAPLGASVLPPPLAGPPADRVVDAKMKQPGPQDSALSRLSRDIRSRVRPSGPARAHPAAPRPAPPP